jgi:hypothetical protein
MARAVGVVAQLQPQLMVDTVEDHTLHLALPAAHLMAVMELIILPDLIHRQQQATDLQAAAPECHRLRVQDLVPAV